MQKDKYIPYSRTGDKDEDEVSLHVIKNRI